jgi:tRNA-dihydrouridine synthase A
MSLRWLRIALSSMREAVTIPVTIKCRLGVDEQDEYADLQHFIETVAARGCGVFIVHARKAWLKGLSPKENREVPPLNYQRVYQLKRDFPVLTILINGGIQSLAEVQNHLVHTDGVMLGRTAYHEPYRLAELEHALFGTPLPDRFALIASKCAITPNATWPRAASSITSAAICSACSRACPARAAGAGI